MLKVFENQSDGIKMVLMDAFKEVDTVTFDNNFNE